MYLGTGTQTRLTNCVIGPNRCARVGGGTGIFRARTAILNFPGTRFLGDDVVIVVDILL
jgi:hypothetical protein